MLCGRCHGGDAKDIEWMNAKDYLARTLNLITYKYSDIANEARE